MNSAVSRLLPCLFLACSCGGPGIPAVNTLQGEEAFPLAALAAHYGFLPDGGPDLSSFTIEAADTRQPNLCPPASAVPGGPVYNLTVQIMAPAGEALSPGTFPIGLPPNIEPPFAEISLGVFESSNGVNSQRTTYAALGGSITCTEIDAQHAACSFSTEVSAVNTAGPARHSLTGNLDAPITCSDAGT